MRTFEGTPFMLVAANKNHYVLAVRFLPDASHSTLVNFAKRMRKQVKTRYNMEGESIFIWTLYQGCDSRGFPRFYDQWEER
jgi:hypothetical protein